MARLGKAGLAIGDLSPQASNINHLASLVTLGCRHDAARYISLFSSFDLAIRSTEEDESRSSSVDIAMAAIRGP
jgi:hypothetical protein